MTEHDSSPIGGGDAASRLPTDAEEFERAIAAAPDLADAFRESMELLTKEASELQEIIGRPIVDAPPARRSPAPVPADRGPTFARIVTTIAAGGLVLVLGGFAYVRFAARSPALAKVAVPLALLPSDHVDTLVLSRLSPPPVTSEPPRLMPLRAAPATAPASPTTSVPSLALPPAPPATAVGTPASTNAPATPAPMISVVAPTIRAEVIAAHTRWFTAYARGDKTTLGALEANGFRMLDMRPPADRVSQHPDATRTIDQVTVEVSGDAVVFAARMVEEIAVPGAERTVISDLSEVWSPSGAGWLLLGTVIRPAALP